MGKMSRNKGAAAEREVAKLLAGALGTEITRNLDQTRDGGYDLKGLNVALEVKRCEQLAINNWWAQAVRQGAESRKVPALVYRQSRKPWRFRLHMRDLFEDMEHIPHEDIEFTVEMELKAFVELLRDI